LLTYVPRGRITGFRTVAEGSSPVSPG